MPTVRAQEIPMPPPNIPAVGISAGIEELVVRLENHIAPKAKGCEWFGWQSLSLSNFCRGIISAREQLGDGQLQFVDVGSGIGTKLFLASRLGFDVTGIELNPDYIVTSQALFPSLPVLQCNALDYNDYDQFDLIYSYRLSRSDRVQQQINEHIIEHMRDGAVFFCVDTVESQDRLMAIDGAQDVD